MTACVNPEWVALRPCEHNLLWSEACYINEDSSTRNKGIFFLEKDTLSRRCSGTSLSSGMFSVVN